MRSMNFLNSMAFGSQVCFLFEKCEVHVVVLYWTYSPIRGKLGFSLAA